MAKKRPVATPPGAKRPGLPRTGLLALGALVLVALVLVGAWLVTQIPPPSNAAIYRNAQSGETPALGPLTATVTLIEYGDFNCPACRKWHADGILRAVLTTYGSRVRVEWRDFPVITAESPHLAVAARCAQAQDAFWPYHDLLYEHQGTLSDDQLVQFATDLKLNALAFRTCLDTRATRPLVERDLAEARALNLSGTPSFTINGTVLIHPPDLVALKSLIDRRLAP